MKKIYLSILAVLFFAVNLSAQSSANYALSTTTTGSLTDMSTGTTQLVAAAVDDGASPVTNIGFNFWFMGVNYTQFSASSNGFVRLGATAVGTTTYSLASATAPLIASFGSDEITSTTGKVHYKLTGTAPNRVLTIEFNNMTVIYDAAGATADATSQVRLYEGTNQVELVYGSIARNSSAGFNSGMEPQYAGFSTSTTSYATITTTTNAVATSGAATSNQYTLGAPVASLTSAADGSRKTYSFLAASATAPSGISFTGISTTAMTVNWLDNATDEIGYAVYRSDDGGATYNLQTITAANATSYVASGLTLNTTYFWRIVVVRETPGASVSGSQATAATAGNIVSNATGGGLWSQASTWAGGVVPGINDNVTIAAGDVVTIDVSPSITGLSVNGTLQYEATTARTLTSATNVTISNGGSFLTGGTVTHTLSLGGNLTNSGTLDFYIGTGGTGITFTGANNSSFSGTGAVNDVFLLTGAKSTRNQIIDINLTNFTVAGLATGSTTGLFASNVGTGTFKFSGTTAFSGTLWSVAGYTIATNAGIWIDNPNFTVVGMNGSPTLNGAFRLTQGTFNIGTAIGNSMGFGSGSSVIVEGGVINAAGRFGVTAATNSINYTQSGGTITVATQGNASTTQYSFDLGTSLTSTIAISGGTIVVQLAGTAATPRDFRNQAGTGASSITGGTLQIGNAASGAAKTFGILGVLPNMVINSTSGNHTVNMLTTLVNYNNYANNITIGSGATFNTGNLVFLFAGASLVNNGTLISNGASSNFVTFLTTAPQVYSGTGVVTAPMTALSIQSDMNFVIDPASSAITVGSIRLFNGNVVNSNKLIVGTGGSSTAIVQIGNTTTPTAAGTFDQPLNYNQGTGGITLIYLRTTAARSTGPEVPSSRAITTLTVDENDLTHPLTIAGGNLSVSGTFTYTNGNIITGSNILESGISVATPGTFTPATTAGVIIGKFKRWITPTAATWNFPVGIASAKRNAAINFTTAPTTGGSLTTEWISTAAGTNGLPLVEPAIPVTLNSTANGYWSVVAGDGLAGGNYTGAFTGTGLGNVVNDYTQLVLVKRSNSAAPWVLDGTHVPATGSAAAPVVSRTGMTGFSEFTIAADGVVNTLPISIVYFRGAKNGNVNDLDWKVNVTNSSSATLILERSANGTTFTPVYNITTTAARALSPFNYVDQSPLTNKNFYRLKMVDASGRATYSNIVVVLNAVKGFEIVNISPNPVVNGTFNLNVTSAQISSLQVKIADAAGRIVNKQTFQLTSGSNSVIMNVNKLAKGTYYIYGITADGRTGTFTFVKQ